MLRILLVDLERGWRGGQSQALLLLEGLRSLGHDARLLSVRESALAVRAEAVGVPVHVASPSWRRFGAARIVRRLLRQKRFDLVHANESHALTAAWLAGAHRRVPLVAARRVAYPISSGLVARTRYRAARRILAVSQFVARSVVDSGLPREIVSVVYDGVKMPGAVSPEGRRKARQAWGALDEAPLIGCVAYLLPEKGQEFLLRALPAVRRRFTDARLLLVGDGPMRLQLERLADALAVRDAVQFAGHLEDLEMVYAALDVFVFPSLAEPLGSSLLSAMAAGLPVVGVASGALPEIIESGKSGILTSRPDPGEIADAVTRLLGNPEFARRLGECAREVVYERFTADRMVEETLKIYLDVYSSR